MSEQKEKKLYEKVFYSKITLVFLIVLIFFMSKAVLGLYEKKQNTRESLEVAELELERAEARKSLLNEKLDSFSTEKGIEMEIRDMFNVAREGEKVIVIVDEEKNISNDDEGGSGGLWNRIKSWFKRD